MNSIDIIIIKIRTILQIDPNIIHEELCNQVLHRIQ